MTPKAFKSGGAGITIQYAIAESLLGLVIVAATERGICAIEFGDDRGALPEQLQKSFPKAQLCEAGPEFSAIIQAVVALIKAPEKGFNLPLDIRGSAFQERVWAALRRIQPGCTASYGEIADIIGQPTAARAVANACGSNTLAVAIPCHRVVRCDGKISGYKWGVERKRLLLSRERDNVEKSRVAVKNYKKI